MSLADIVKGHTNRALDEIGMLPSDITSLGKERLDICKACPTYKETTSTCNNCGCYMKAKVLVDNAKCPEGKW
jgi:hypothetical protein